MTTEHTAATDSSITSGRTGIRVDKDLLRAAAWELRHDATQASYRGLQRPERAYALASVLDLFELRWIEQDGAVRDEVRRCCRVLLSRDDDAVLEDR